MRMQVLLLRTPNLKDSKECTEEAHIYSIVNEITEEQVNAVS